MSGLSFPNESETYRQARAQLLSAEVALREQTEKVAAMRRALPIGGRVPENYGFEGPDGEVLLSEMFGGKDTLFVYGFMFGPEAKQPCPLCSSFLDALDGNVPHLLQRIGVAIVAKSPLARIQKFASERSWRNLPLLSSANNSYQRDYHAESEHGQMPMANVFVRRDGEMFHSWGSEMLYEPNDAGDSRHIDSMWPLWNVFDTTPEGRGKDWYPNLP